jgi:hypothetical protein
MVFDSGREACAATSPQGLGMRVNAVKENFFRTKGAFVYLVLKPGNNVIHDQGHGRGSIHSGHRQRSQTSR